MSRSVESRRAVARRRVRRSRRPPRSPGAASRDRCAIDRRTESASCVLAQNGDVLQPNGRRQAVGELEPVAAVEQRDAERREAVGGLSVPRRNVSTGSLAGSQAPRDTCRRGPRGAELLGDVGAGAGGVVDRRPPSTAGPARARPGRGGPRSCEPGEVDAREVPVLPVEGVRLERELQERPERRRPGSSGARAGSSTARGGSTWPRSSQSRYRGAWTAISIYSPQRVYKMCEGAEPGGGPASFSDEVRRRWPARWSRRRPRRFINASRRFDRWRRLDGLRHVPGDHPAALPVAAQLRCARAAPTLVGRGVEPALRRPHPACSSRSIRRASV